MLRNNWDKIELYIISLWLLFLLIIVVTLDVPICFKESCGFDGFGNLLLSNIIPIISLLLLLTGLLFVLRFKYKLSGSVQTPIIIKNIQNQNYEHLTFLSTNIVPLIAFDLTKPRYFIVLIILLFAIGKIYLKTNLFYANPTLAFFGYRIYKAEGRFRTGTKSNIILISMEKLTENQKVSYRKIDENIYYVRVLK